MARTRRGGRRGPGRALGARLARGLLLALVALLLGSVGWVALYRVIDPPLTFIEARDLLNGTGVDQSWVPLGGIARTMPRAAIAAEDANFCAHDGFDFEAMRRAATRNAAGGRLRGGSTISQQTAKNVFLWPGRSYLRKGLEAWFTLLIEQLWGKRRIMAVYLNVVELGRGVYGVEAAAQRYFQVRAARLSPTQAARLAAILPNPKARDAAAPSRATRRYAGRIGARERIVRRDALDGCLSG